MKVNAHKHLVNVLGNHEVGRILKRSEITYYADPIKAICDSKMIPYSISDVYFKLHLNHLSYLFYLTHGYSGALNADYPIKKLFRYGFISDRTDFIVVGHSHHNAVVPIDRYVTLEDEVMHQQIIGLRPGTFLKEPNYVRPRPQAYGNMILRLYSNNKLHQIYANLDEWRQFNGGN